MTSGDADYETAIQQWELEHHMAGPCPECGAAGACAYDELGRPMTHVVRVDQEDDHDLEAR